MTLTTPDRVNWKYIAFIASLLALLAMMSAIYQARESARARRELAATTTALRHLKESRRTILLKKVHTAPIDMATWPGEPDNPIPSELPTPAQRQALAKARYIQNRNVSEAQERHASSPDFHRRTAEQFRKNMAVRYGALYRSLGLRPDEVSRFENAMVESFWAMSDLLSASRLVGVTHHTAFALKRELSKSIEAKLHSVLGEMKFQQYANFEHTMDAREISHALASKVYNSDTPLTALQGEHLIKLVAANRIEPASPRDWILDQMFARTVRDPPWTEINWDAVINKARGVLSPHQLSVLVTLKDDARLKDKIRQEMKDIENKARASPPR